MTVRSNRTSARARAALLLALLAAAAAAGCGKKGPPLAPLRPVPATLSVFSAKRLGQTVWIQVTVPAVSVEGWPAYDLDRIDVYAFTGRVPTELDDPKRATLVGSIPVKRIISDDQLEKWKKLGVPPPPNPGVDVGGVATVAETLTAETMIPYTPKRVRKVPVAPTLENEFGHVLEPPVVGPVAEARPLKRFYLAQGVSQENVKGAMAPVGAVLLRPPPPSPEPPEPKVDEPGVTVTWTPSPDLRLPIQEPVPAAALAAAAAAAAPGSAQVTAVLAGKTFGMLPEPVFTYNVYVPGAAPVIISPAAPTAPPMPVFPAKGDPLPMPLNPAPLPALTYQDTTVVFGTERCFAVRTVETLGDTILESESSTPACVTPVDTFPPPAPAALSAVAAEGAISLIWDGVEAKDLAGYLVLRSEGADKPLEPLFEEPIRETTYRDTTAKPGVRYSYAIASVDTATPRNVSAPSPRVEEAAR